MPGFFADAFADLLASELGENIAYSRNGGAATTVRALVPRPDVEGEAGQIRFQQDRITVKLSQSVGFEPQAQADTFVRSSISGTYHVAGPAEQDEAADAWVFEAYRG